MARTIPGNGASSPKTFVKERKNEKTCKRKPWTKVSTARLTPFPGTPETVSAHLPKRQVGQPPYREALVPTLAASESTSHGRLETRSDWHIARRSINSSSLHFQVQPVLSLYRQTFSLDLDIDISASMAPGYPTPSMMFPPRSPSIVLTRTPADSIILAAPSPALLSNSSESAEAKNLQELPLLDDLAVLTLLLRLVVILNCVNGNTSLDGFADDLSFEPDSFISNGTADGPLDAIGAIIVQCHDTVAAAYLKDGSNNFIALCHRQSAVERNEKKHLCGRLHILRHVKTDEDDGHWPEILSNPECRMIKGPTSIEEHISTLCAYLNDYRSHPSVQSDYSNRFFKYLLTVCWPSIYRRISSWRGLGFIYRLYHCQFNSQIAKDANWGDTEYDMTHDKRLCRFLSEHDNVVNGLSSIFEWLPVRGPSIDFQALAAAAKCGNRLYTRETANEFHHFVFAAFVMFGHSLSLFGKAVNLSRAGHKLNSEGSLLQLFYGLQAHTTLILYLTTSSAFAKHMEVFQNILGLQELVPDFDERGEYRKFGESMKIWDHDLVSRRCPVNKALSCLDTGASDMKADHPCDFGRVVHLKLNGLKAPPEPLTAGAFVRWLKTFVLQFLAQRELQAQCRVHYDIPIKMPLLTVDCVRYRVPSWDNFKETIEIALRTTIYPRLPIRIPNVFRLLEEKLMHFTPCDTDVNVNMTVNIFRGLMEGKVEEITLAPHCEAVLAAFVKFCPDNELTTNEGLAQICKELKESVISVSKRCCPVCRELLHSLKGEEADQDTRTECHSITVRGCHSTVCATVLPTWLPPHIYGDMMLKFQGYLRRELCKLLNTSLNDNHSLEQNHVAKLSSGALTIDDPEKRGLGSKFYLKLTYHPIHKQTFTCITAPKMEAVNVTYECARLNVAKDKRRLGVTAHN
ncbi:hypothetical protein F5887DRAFT_1215946 [Amanita rubescens]|nr:hypothetical protein F5887DRAFT_1215946 [Amanita rubescens]